MLRETKNNVIIEGILNEVELEVKTYRRKKTNEEKTAIMGSYTVRVDLEKDGEVLPLYIPVHVFADEITNAGKRNPSFDNLQKILTNFQSIAASDEATASRVRVTGAKIAMNEYFSEDGRFMAYPRVQASFITEVKKEDFNPKAKWEMEVYINAMKDEYGRDEQPTGALLLDVIGVNFFGDPIVTTFKVINPKIIDPIKNTYQEGDTVTFHGVVYFSSTVVKETIDVEIGEPIVKDKTIQISDLLLTGAEAALDEGGLDSEDLQVAMNKRNADLQAKKEAKANAAPSNGESKAPKAGLGIGIDHGF